MAHEAGGVYHAEFIDKLHRILQGGVEEEAAGTDEKIANKSDEEDGIMAVPEATADADIGETEEENVGEGIDDFGRILSEVVVLIDENGSLLASGQAMDWMYEVIERNSLLLHTNLM